MHKQVNQVNGKLSRIYKDKQCKNPNCINGGSYIPKRSNQDFCIPKCKEIYHNDIKKMMNKTIYADEKQLKRADNILQYFFTQFVNSDGHCSVPVDYFKARKFDVNLLVRYKITGNKLQVKCFYRYCYFVDPNDPNKIIIIKNK
jgi:hypothetical protein